MLRNLRHSYPSQYLRPSWVFFLQHLDILNHNVLWINERSRARPREQICKHIATCQSVFEDYNTCLSGAYVPGPSLTSRQFLYSERKINPPYFAVLAIINQRLNLKESLDDYLDDIGPPKAFDTSFEKLRPLLVSLVVNYLTGRPECVWLQTCQSEEQHRGSWMGSAVPFPVPPVHLLLQIWLIPVICRRF